MSHGSRMPCFQPLFWTRSCRLRRVAQPVAFKQDHVAPDVQHERQYIARPRSGTRLLLRFQTHARLNAIMSAFHLVLQCSAGHSYYRDGGSPRFTVFWSTCDSVDLAGASLPAFSFFVSPRGSWQAIAGSAAAAGGWNPAGMYEASLESLMNPTVKRWDPSDKRGSTAL